MKLVVITYPQKYEGEIDLIKQMLDGDVDRLHIRKPGDPDATEEILRALSPSELRKVTVHYFYDLARKYGASGIERNYAKDASAVEWDGTIGASCHTLDEVRQWADRYGYCFLSPIYDSISKTGYQSAFSEETLRKATAEGVINEKVIALGGIRPENVGYLNDLGFGGVAILGGIWGKGSEEADKVMERVKRYSDAIDATEGKASAAAQGNGTATQQEKETSNAPIVLFVYNRPEHTRRTIEALKRADGASESPLIIFSDGPKKGAEKKVEEVRAILHDINGFGKVSIVEHKENIGLAQNIITGVSKVLKVHDRVIVLEDDLVVSAGFLTYMNKALAHYKEKGVFSISGYTPEVSIPDDYGYSTYMIHRNCSWGWGTWRSKWEKVDWQVSDFRKFIGNRIERYHFDMAGTDLSAMLLKQQMGEIHSWSIRFCYTAFICGEPTVYPVRSLVQNGGTDGSGTNMKRCVRYDTQVTDYIDCSAFNDSLIINTSILDSFRSKYNCSSVRRVINFFKRQWYLLRK